MSTKSTAEGVTNYNIVQLDGEVETINLVNINKMQLDSDGNICLSSGTTIPANGSTGFSKGGIFMKTDAASGYNGLYSNFGTSTSSLFEAVTTAKSFTATVGFADADYICTGTNDDVVIQQAINDVSALGGGNIAFQDGTYNLSATIVVPKNAYVRLMGAKIAKGATGGTILRAATTLTNLFSWTGNANPSTNADLAHDFMVEQMTFNGSGTTTNLFLLTNQDYFVMDFCRCISATNSIKTVWNSSSDPTNTTIPGGCFISNSIISANSGIGLDLQYQTQCWISNIWWDGTSVTSWINFKACNKIKVTNCEYNTATTALSFSDTATVSCHDISVTGGTCVGTKFITDTRSNAGSNRVSITGNTILSTDTSDKLFGTGNTFANGSYVTNAPFVTVGFDNTCQYTCDGVADDVQINAAIAFASAHGIQKVILTGTTPYDITAPIDNSVSGLAIEGNSYGYYADTVVLKASAALAAVFKISAQFPGMLSNVTIDGNSTATDGLWIGKSGYVAKLKNVCLRNVKIKNCTGYGIKGVSGIASGSWDDSSWYNVALSSNATGLRNDSTLTNIFGLIIAGNTTCGVEIATSSKFNIYGVICSGNAIDFGYNCTTCQPNLISGGYTESAGTSVVAALNSTTPNCETLTFDSFSIQTPPTNTFDFTGFTAGYATFRDCRWSGGSIITVTGMDYFFNGFNGTPPTISGAGFINSNFSHPLFKTGDYTVLATDSGRTFITNTNDVTFTLPAAQPGLKFTFLIGQTGKNLTVVRAGSNHINSGVQAAGDSTQGSTITLIAIDTSNWFEVSKIGVWTIT